MFNVRIVSLARPRISKSTVQGAEHFARIRSYLSTARKQGRNILDSITAAIKGAPFMPAASA